MKNIRIKLILLFTLASFQHVMSQNNEGSVSGGPCNCEYCVDGENGDSEDTCVCESGYNWQEDDCVAASLSPGAIAGIAVGSVIGAVVIFGAVYYFCFYKPRKNSIDIEMNSRLTYRKQKDVHDSESEVNESHENKSFNKDESDNGNGQNSKDKTSDKNKDEQEETSDKDEDGEEESSDENDDEEGSKKDNSSARNTNKDDGKEKSTSF